MRAAPPSTRRSLALALHCSAFTGPRHTLKLLNKGSSSTASRHSSRRLCRVRSTGAICSQSDFPGSLIVRWKLAITGRSTNGRSGAFGASSLGSNPSRPARIAGSRPRVALVQRSSRQPEGLPTGTGSTSGLFSGHNGRKVSIGTSRENTASSYRAVRRTEVSLRDFARASCTSTDRRPNRRTRQKQQEHTKVNQPGGFQT